ncbi:RadC family protein [Desulforegula conservatrix]|uniref:RadC family protein n=1 Tax=Desulforegula conservatrix TaxID=153026 RepID=UPI000485212A|nr:DNA repair protein RadC [Desulforegula conservatrix]
MASVNDGHNEGHRQRLRERFLEDGLDGFHDYEVVELLLTVATPRKDCKPAAKEALTRFKNITGVMEASSEALMKINGVGDVNVFGIKLIKAICERYLKDRVFEDDIIRNPSVLFDYLNMHMGNRDREYFSVVYLNAKNRVLDVETLFEGTLTSSAVYPREVVKNAMEKKAASLIFAHNHPSGDPEPSKADMEITRRLTFACRLVDISVLEHLIMGGKKYFSFADSGHIAGFEKDYEILVLK